MNAHHAVGELEHGIREVRPGRAGHAGVVFAALHQLRGDLDGVGHVAPRSPRVDAGQGDVARRRVRAAQPDADALPFVPVPPRDHAGRLMRGHGDASFASACDDEMRFRASAGDSVEQTTKSAAKREDARRGRQPSSPLKSCGCRRGAIVFYIVPTLLAPAVAHHQRNVRHRDARGCVRRHCSPAELSPKLNAPPAQRPARRRRRQLYHRRRRRRDDRSGRRRPRRPRRPRPRPVAASCAGVAPRGGRVSDRVTFAASRLWRRRRGPRRRRLPHARFPLVPDRPHADPDPRARD